MVEVGLRGNSLRIEANDQTEAIRLAKDVALEDGLLIFAQRMDEKSLLKMKPPTKAPNMPSAMLRMQPSPR